MASDRYMATKGALETIAIEKLRTTCSRRFTRCEIDPDRFQVTADFDNLMDCWIVEVVTHLAMVKDDKKFKTETKTERSEYSTITRLLPETIWDHIKHNFVTWFEKVFRTKLSKIQVNYAEVTTIVHSTVTNNNHITILEYICPHIDIPRGRPEHTIFLMKGPMEQDVRRKPFERGWPFQEPGDYRG